MEYHRYFISNRYSAQEFGEVNKLAQRDSNPGPSRRQYDKGTITPQGKVNWQLPLGNQSLQHYTT